MLNICLMSYQTCQTRCFSLQGSAAAVGETSYDGAGTESVQEEGDGLSVCLSVSVSVTDTEMFVFCLSVVL